MYSAGKPYQRPGPPRAHGARRLSEAAHQKGDHVPLHDLLPDIPGQPVGEGASRGQSPVDQGQGEGQGRTPEGPAGRETGTETWQAPGPEAGAQARQAAWPEARTQAEGQAREEVEALPAGQGPADPPRPGGSPSTASACHLSHRSFNAHAMRSRGSVRARWPPSCGTILRRNAPLVMASL